jgi:hypothetical protein
LAEAQDCSNNFQNLHQRTNLTKCDFHDFLSSSAPNLCSKRIDSIINFHGVERHNALTGPIVKTYLLVIIVMRVMRHVLTVSRFYRQSLQSLREGDSFNGKRCGEALLVSPASSDVDSPNWVHGTFS